MKAYAIGNLSRVEMGPPTVAYLERIDATLAPFGGRFLIHGGDKEVLEGNWSSDLIVIEFPTSTGHVRGMPRRLIRGSFLCDATTRTGPSSSWKASERIMSPPTF